MKNKEEKLEWWEKSIWNKLVKRIHESYKVIEERQDLVDRILEAWDSDDTKIKNVLEPILGEELFKKETDAVVWVEGFVKQYEEVKLERDELKKKLEVS